MGSLLASIRGLLEGEARGRAAAAMGAAGSGGTGGAFSLAAAAKAASSSGVAFGTTRACLRLLLCCPAQCHRRLQVIYGRRETAVKTITKNGSVVGPSDGEATARGDRAPAHPTQDLHARGLPGGTATAG